MHFRAVEHDRHVSDGTTATNAQMIGLHHAIFEQVGLDCRSQIEGGTIAYFDEIEL